MRDSGATASPVLPVLAPAPPSGEVFRSFPETYFAVRKVGRAVVTIRSIQAEDEPLLAEFHKTVSDYSVHFRYFGTLSLRQRTLHERLRRHCVLDFTREFALVADQTGSNGVHQILGVGRLCKEPGRDEAEFAVIISDQWQGKGLGTLLLRRLMRVGRQSDLRRIVGHILADNSAMKKVSDKVGFKLRLLPEADEWLAEFDL